MEITLQSALSAAADGLHSGRDDHAERWLRAALMKAPDDVTAITWLASASVDLPGRCAAFARKAVGLLRPDTPLEIRLLSAALQEATGVLAGPATSKNPALPPAKWVARSARDVLLDSLRKAKAKTPAMAPWLKRHLVLPLGEAGPTPDELREAACITPPVPLPVAATEQSYAWAQRRGLELAEAGHLREARAWLTQAAGAASATVVRWPAERRAMRGLHDSLTALAGLEADDARTGAAHTARKAGPACEADVLLRLELWEAAKAAASGNLTSLPQTGMERMRWLHVAALAELQTGARDRGLSSLRSLRECLALTKTSPGSATDREQEECAVLVCELEAWFAAADGMDSVVRELRPRLAALPPLRLARLLHRIGQKEDALATLAGSQDIPALAFATGLRGDLPAAEAARVRIARCLADPASDAGCMAALRQLAEAKGLQPQPVPRRDDLLPSGRPASLWEGQTAPPLRLRDAGGTEHTLNDGTGHPVIVQFFMGHSCDHCLRQLDMLARWYPQLEAAGIRVLAVTVDGPEGAATTFAGPDRAARLPYAFPILANPGGAAFRAWGAWDEFTGLPVHGSFVVDSQAVIRWQATSNEPWMAVNVLYDLAARTKLESAP